MELAHVEPAVAVALEAAQHALRLGASGSEAQLLECTAHLRRAEPAVAVLVEELESPEHLSRRRPTQRLLVEHVRYQRRELYQAQPAVAVGVMLAQPLPHLGRPALHAQPLEGGGELACGEGAGAVGVEERKGLAHLVRARARVGLGAGAGAGVGA